MIRYLTKRIIKLNLATATRYYEIQTQLVRAAYALQLLGKKKKIISFMANAAIQPPLHSNDR